MHNITRATDSITIDAFSDWLFLLCFLLRLLLLFILSDMFIPPLRDIIIDSFAEIKGQHRRGNCRID